MAEDHGRLSRREFLKRSGAGIAAVGLGGAAAPYAFAGPHKYTGRYLKNNLSIMQWVHFVPAYDTWLDQTYAVQWGQANDTQVTIDHVALTELPARAAAEVAAGSGHDLFQFLAPPATYQNSTIPVDDAVQQVTKKLGQMTNVGYKSTYNPKTKHFFGFADNYVPDPVVWRHDLWNAIGESPATWNHVLKAAPKLKAKGTPIGIGMSNELDSNMANFAIMLCFGAQIQNVNGNVVINSKQTVNYLNFMKSLYQTGMNNDIFGWTPASNNQYLYSGVGSLILTAISATRTPEQQGLPFANDLWIWPIPAGPVQRLGLEHVMGIYVIWKFSQNPDLAKKYLIDQQLAYQDHFMQSQFYNFPAWTNAVKGGFKAIHKLTAQDTHKPLGKYTILATIAEKYTTNAGHPGFANAAVGEIFDTFLIPQMAAQVAQGKMSAQDAAKAADGQFKAIFKKWRDAGLL
jgi:multiple sugar transport system substrate-binding protein